MALTLVGIGTKVSGRSAWLDDPAAGAYKRMLKAGCPTGCITDAGRTGPEQIEIFMARFTTDYARSAKYDKRLWRGVAWWRKVGATNAATPGTSNHETGRALDLAEPARSWVRAHGAAYGWLKDRVRNEPWHMEYLAVHDTHRNDIPTPPPAPTPTPAKDWFDMATEAELRAIIRRADFIRFRIVGKPDVLCEASMAAGTWRVYQTMREVQSRYDVLTDRGWVVEDWPDPVTTTSAFGRRVRNDWEPPVATA